MVGDNTPSEFEPNDFSLSKDGDNSFIGGIGDGIETCPKVLS